MEKLVWNQLQQHAGRLLSQVDRDPDSPSYGSFDRNYWNYKIRDFSSAILQQGILALDVLYSYNNEENIYRDSPLIKDLIKAGVNYWSKIQLKSGAFNEYYPYESGFPPTAFSLYAVSLVLRKYPQFINDQIIHSINKSIKWLLKHPEREALNQESAALAGMVVAKTIEGVRIDNIKLQKRLAEFYESQSTEGWFEEYGGPDIGYLSVTIDSLWDIFQYSNDERSHKALEKATCFIEKFIAVSGHTPVMINSRNTDYIVPFGLSGFGSLNDKAASVAYAILNRLADPDHMFNITDDRYLSHYIGQSYFRSLLNITKLKKEKKLPCNSDFEEYLPDSKIFIKHIPAKKSIYISLHKGGIFNVYNTNGIINTDYGWRYKIKNKIGVTHWQDSTYSCEYNKKDDIITLKISGCFSEHTFLKPSPLKHIILRGMSFLMGNKIMSLLKQLIIFNKKTGVVCFERTIKINNGQIDLNDNFSNRIKTHIELYPAPHYSMRHVSSAGRFTYEELLNIN